LDSINRPTKDGMIVIPENARKAGVLVLFYPVSREVNLVFMKRNEYPGVHSGQISFPGGARETGDRDIVETALREAEEEIGIDRESVNIVGSMTDLFIPPSNFLVTPVAGYSHTRPDFRADPKEVSQLLEFSIDHFLDKNARQEKDITIFPEVKIKVPCYFAKGHVIWGATAMILSEVIDLINREP